MILKTYPNKYIYGKYFLVTEAPDDEEVTENAPKPKRNVQVVSVKPSNRGKDFTQVGNPVITSNDTDTDGEIDTDDTDFGADQGQDDATQEAPPAETTQPAETTEDPTQDNQPAENTETQEDQPDTGEGDTTDFTDDQTSDQGDENETGEDGPDLGGDEDFTADAGDGNDQNQQATDQNNTPPANQPAEKPNAPGVELDSTRKYNLFKEYMSLYNACDNYIGKLENILKDDNDENKIIRISVNNLREIKDILYDYMTIRFQLNTYVQSLLFYQKMVVAVQLVFNLLRSIKSNKKTK